MIQYKNKEFRKLIEQTLRTEDNKNLSFHYQYIYLALSQYPDKIYDGLKEQIKLTELQSHNLEYSMDTDT